MYKIKSGSLTVGMITGNSVAVWCISYGKAIRVDFDLSYDICFTKITQAQLGFQHHRQNFVLESWSN